LRQKLTRCFVTSLWCESARDVSRAAGDGSGGMTSVWSRKFLDLPNGIPSQETFARVYYNYAMMGFGGEPYRNLPNAMGGHFDLRIK
jgi:hypothetical protein